MAFSTISMAEFKARHINRSPYYGVDKPLMDRLETLKPEQEVLLLKYTEMGCKPEKLHGAIMRVRKKWQNKHPNGPYIRSHIAQLMPNLKVPSEYGIWLQIEKPKGVGRPPAPRTST